MEGLRDGGTENGKGVRSKCGWVGWKKEGRNGTSWDKEAERIIIRSDRLLVFHETQSSWERTNGSCEHTVDRHERGGRIKKNRCQG